MSWRLILACAALAATLFPACVEIPVGGSSDSGSWNDGGYREYPDSDRGYDYENERVWERAHERYPCDKIEERIRYDRAKLAGIDRSKHHKAYDWYQDDLRDAERNRDECGDYRRKKRENAEWERREHDRRAYEQQRLECTKLQGRIATDRAKLSQIDRAKHHKAYDWYQDDLRNAERQLSACRR